MPIRIISFGNLSASCLAPRKIGFAQAGAPNGLPDNYREGATNGTSVLQFLRNRPLLSLAERWLREKIGEALHSLQVLKYQQL